jgi:hypothetical protein
MDHFFAYWSPLGGSKHTRPSCARSSTSICACWPLSLSRSPTHGFLLTLLSLCSSLLLASPSLSPVVSRHVSGASFKLLCLAPLLCNRLRMRNKIFDMDFAHAGAKGAWNRDAVDTVDSSVTRESLTLSVGSPVLVWDSFRHWLQREQADNQWWIPAVRTECKLACGEICPRSGI